MSFGSTTISTSEPRLGALTFQNSAYGLPVPLFWGTSRLTGNLIWYGDFTATAKTTTTSSGGKGGGDVESKNTSYSYTSAFMLGLCEGAVNSISTVWKDKEKTTFSALGLTLLTGTLPQSVWGHLTTNHPAEAISYPGLAVVAHSAFALGGSASLPQMSFEVSGPRQFGSGIVDARPDEIVTDLLTNARYGAGFPSARLSLSVYRTYAQADGLFLSPMLNTQQAASQHLEEILQATNSAALWSEGLLKLIPYGDSTVIGNGTTYTPAITPQYDLTDDDFIVTGAEPPIVVRRKPGADAYNQFQVEYRNRSNEYNIDIAEAKDLGCISTYGLRAADPVRLHAICEGAVADKVVNTLMQRKLYIRNEYEFRLSWRFCLLEPMDIVTLTHAPLGLSLFQVRIAEIEEDEDGLLRVIAEEFPFGVATPAAIQTQTPSGYSVDFNVAPGNANAPVIFEPPLSLSMQPEVWLATSGGSSWGGCEVWVSLDNATYKQAGTLYGPSRHGTLTAILASGSDPDTVNTLAVDLSVSAGQLVSGTLDDRDLYTTLCYADGELVSYQTATLTALNKYSLTSLRRGVHGTPIGSHTIGSKFARLDQAVFRFAYTPDYLGKTVYIKLRSFNIYGAAAQDLSAVTPTTYAIAGAAVGTVQGFALAQPWVSSTLSVKWTAYEGAAHYKIEVWASSVLKRTVDNIAATAFDYTIEDSKADGGPYRALELRLFAVTTTGQSTTAAILTPSNPQFGAGDVTGIVVEAGPGQINIKADKPAALDYSGTVIWAGDTSVFTPSDLNKIYDGPSPAFVYVIVGGTTKYIKMAHYDSFGKDSLGISTSVGATSILAGGVPTVSTLPGSTYLGDDVVLYDGDSKLYRWTGTAYTKAVDGSDILASSVTSDKITAASLAAISANLGTITAGNMTLATSGYIKGGATGYLTGTGFWMGYNATAYKFHIGNPSGNHIKWDGSALTIAGVLSGATGTFSGALTAATGTLGTLTLASGGNIKMGQTAYNTGTGFWIGDDGGTAKMSIGVASGNRLTWNGTTLEIAGSLSDARPYTSGSIVLALDDPEASTSSTTYIKMKEMYCPSAGVLSVSFAGRDTTGTGTAVIYINGASVGTVRTLAVGVATFTQNITVAAGDSLQLYAKNPGGTSRVKQFKVSCGFVTFARPVITFTGI